MIRFLNTCAKWVRETLAEAHKCYLVGNNYCLFYDVKVCFCLVEVVLVLIFWRRNLLQLRLGISLWDKVEQADYGRKNLESPEPSSVKRDVNSFGGRK